MARTGKSSERIHGLQSLRKRINISEWEMYGRHGVDVKKIRHMFGE